MKDRSAHEVSLLPDELSGVALQLSPSVQLVQIPTLHPGGIRIPQWAALILVDGGVEGSIHTPCPIDSYSTGCQVLAQTLQSREALKVPSDFEPVTGDIAEPSLFGGGA